MTTPLPRRATLSPDPQPREQHSKVLSSSNSANPPELFPGCLSPSPQVAEGGANTTNNISPGNNGKDGTSPRSDGSSPISYFCGDGPSGGTSSPPITRFNPAGGRATPTPPSSTQQRGPTKGNVKLSSRSVTTARSNTGSTTTTTAAAGQPCIDVCEAAMDLVAFLEQDSLPKLEQVFKQRSTKKDGSLSRLDFVSLLSQVVSGISLDRRSSSANHSAFGDSGLTSDIMDKVNLGNWRNSVLPSLHSASTSRATSLSITTTQGQGRRATSAATLGRSVSPQAHQPKKSSDEESRQHQDDEMQEDQYQAMLDATADNLIDSRVLTYVAQCVDPYAADKITFSAFLDFLVQSGRATSQGPPPVLGDDNGADDARLQAGVKNGAKGHKKNKIKEGMSPIVVPAATQSPDPSSQKGKAPYLFLATVNKEGMPFVGATRRYAEIVDAFGQAAPHAKRMTPPLEPSEMITCLHYASSINEVFVGASNCKVYSFSVPEGHLLRECRAALAPRCLAWAAPPKLSRATPAIAEPRMGPHSTDDNAKVASGGHQPTGILYVGMEDGTLVGMSAPLSGVLRVNTTVKVGSSPVEAIEVVPSVGSVVCACGRTVIVACSRTGALRQKPYKADSQVSALFYHSTSGGLGFTVKNAPNSVFFFSRRTLNSVANEPAEIVRDRSTLGESTCSITLDPTDPHRAITVDVSGFLRYWNLSTLQPCYNVSGDTTEGSGGLDSANVSSQIETLRVPGAPSHVAMSSMPGSRSTPPSAMFLTKYGLYKLIPVKTSALAAAAKEADVLQGIAGAHLAAVSGPHQSEEKKGNMSSVYDPDTLVTILPCNPQHHGSVTHALGFHPNSCVFSVTSSEIKLQHFQSTATAADSTTPVAEGGLKTNKTLWCVPLNTKFRETRQQALRPTAACFLPGEMVVLMGSSSGALFTVSVEPSQQGLCHLVSETFCDIEISQLMVDSHSKTVVAILFDGTALAAQISLDPSNYTHPVKVSQPSRMSGLTHVKSAAFDEERRLCFFLDVPGTPTSSSAAPSNSQVSASTTGNDAPFILQVFDFGAPHEGIRWRASLPIDAPPTSMLSGFEAPINSSPVPSSARLKARNGTYGFIFASGTPIRKSVGEGLLSPTTKVVLDATTGGQISDALAKTSSQQQPQEHRSKDPTTCHGLLRLLPASTTAAATPADRPPTSSFFLTAAGDSSRNWVRGGNTAARAPTFSSTPHKKLGLLLAWGTGESSMLVLSYCAEDKVLEVDTNATGSSKHFHFGLGGPPTDFCVPSAESQSCYVAHSHGDLSHVSLMAAPQIAFPSLVSPNRGGGGFSPSPTAKLATQQQQQPNMARAQRLLQAKQGIKSLAHVPPVPGARDESSAQESSQWGGLAFGTDSDCYLIDAHALAPAEEDDGSASPHSNSASTTGGRSSLLGTSTPRRLIERGSSFCVGGNDPSSALQGSLSAAIVARRRHAQSATVRRTPSKSGSISHGTIDQRASFMLPTGTLKRPGAPTIHTTTASTRVASAALHRPVSGFGTATPGIGALRSRNVNSAGMTKLPTLKVASSSRSSYTYM